MSVTLSVTWDSVSLLFHPKIRYLHDGSNVLNVVSAIRKLKLATGDFGKESCKASSQLDGTRRWFLTTQILGRYSTEMGSSFGSLVALKRHLWNFFSCKSFFFYFGAKLKIALFRFFCCRTDCIGPSPGYRNKCFWSFDLCRIVTQSHSLFVKLFFKIQLSFHQNNCVDI